jgi:hypothetical protein
VEVAVGALRLAERNLYVYAKLRHSHHNLAQEHPEALAGTNPRSVSNGVFCPCKLLGIRRLVIEERADSNGNSKTDPQDPEYEIASDHDPFQSGSYQKNDREYR